MSQMPEHQYLTIWKCISTSTDRTFQMPELASLDFDQSQMDLIELVPVTPAPHELGAVHMLSQVSILYPYANHGAGIFTYITG